MNIDTKKDLALLLLLVFTPIAIIPQNILFNYDNISHIIMSAIIAIIYYTAMSSKGSHGSLLLQTFTVCITIGILKEMLMDAQIEWPDIIADLLGASIGIQTIRLKI